jgi:hypothetical protein
MCGDVSRIPDCPPAYTAAAQPTALGGSGFPIYMPIQRVHQECLCTSQIVFTQLARSDHQVELLLKRFELSPQPVRVLPLGCHCYLSHRRPMHLKFPASCRTRNRDRFSLVTLSDTNTCPSIFSSSQAGRRGKTRNGNCDASLAATS